MARDFKGSILCVFVIVGFIAAVGYGRATSDDQGSTEISDHQDEYLAPAVSDCEEGQHRRIACNTCSCNSGRWQCTTRQCYSENTPQDVCMDGETIKIACNTCSCTNGRFKCTSNSCSSSSDVGSKRDAILAGFIGDKSRSKRETPLTADLKNTPCAPNDYFQIDCNTCYCKIDRSGYLCTENIACEKNIDSSTTTQVPMSDGAMLIITDHGANLVNDFNTNDNNLSRIGHTSPIQIANSLAGLNDESATTHASAKH